MKNQGWVQTGNFANYEILKKDGILVLYCPKQKKVIFPDPSNSITKEVKSGSVKTDS